MAVLVLSPQLFLHYPQLPAWAGAFMTVELGMTDPTAHRMEDIVISCIFEGVYHCQKCYIKINSFNIVLLAKCISQ